MILLLATGVGCVAIWPMTVPKQHSHREVAMLALPMEDSRNPVKKSQGVVEGRLGLALWESCMMKRDMNIPLMTMVNYMYPITPSRLLPLERLRRKRKNKQKTKKVLCQCIHCWCYTFLNWFRTV